MIINLTPRTEKIKHLKKCYEESRCIFCGFQSYDVGDTRPIYYWYLLENHGHDKLISELEKNQFPEIRIPVCQSCYSQSGVDKKISERFK